MTIEQTIQELKALKEQISPQTASAYVADGIKALKKLVKLIRANNADDDAAEAETLAAEALELASNIRLVAGVAGIEYELEDQADNLQEDFGYSLPGSVEALYDVLEEMEGQSYGWNSSSRYC